ncbi:type IV pilus modification protein PilV [Dokdonella sp.]|uniref:type IV pilus modification protein PilV n=1 Tax=Dokdonella sp. TaxID=2291710 RepID=UPI002F4165E7
MRRTASRGFTLLEVLIALLVFSLGLLGVAGLMVVSVKTNNSAYLRTQASFLAQSMADRMRANTGKINDYNGDYDSSTASNSYCSASCDPDDIVARDRALWSQQLTSLLPPNTTANINCVGNVLGTPATSGASTYDGICTFTISWNEATLEQSNSPGLPPPQTFAWVFQP